MEMRKTLVSLSTLALIAGFGASAYAQGMGMGMGRGMGRGPVAQACAAEIGRHCAGVSHGGGKVRACLNTHRASLSSGCGYALDHTGYGRRGQ
jgi:hypothetical protein